MQMKTTLSNHIEAFREEALLILRFYIAYSRISKFEDFNLIGRTTFVDRIIALKAIENDLVIRICKFDDNRNGVHSFLKAKSEIPAGHKNIEAIKVETETFKNAINDLKKRRHEKLAHLKIGEHDSEYEPKYDLLPPIKLIITIIDAINGEKVNYNWSDGRYEKYDLRNELGI